MIKTVAAWACPVVAATIALARRGLAPVTRGGRPPLLQTISSGGRLSAVLHSSDLAITLSSRSEVCHFVQTPRLRPHVSQTALDVPFCRF